MIKSEQVPQFECLDGIIISDSLVELIRGTPSQSICSHILFWPPSLTKVQSLKGHNKTIED